MCTVICRVIKEAFPGSNSNVHQFRKCASFRGFLKSFDLISVQSQGQGGGLPLAHFLTGIFHLIFLMCPT